MEFITATDAARLLSVSDKTIRAWLKAGRFPGARLVKIKNLRQWAIPLTEVQEVRQEETSNETTGVLPEVMRKLEVLENRIRLLETQVLELQVSKHLASIETTGDIPVLPVEELHKTDERVAGPLPSSYVSFVSCYLHHGIPETTALRYTRGCNDRVTQGKWYDEKGHTVKLALSPSQQAAFYQYFHEHKSFQACPKCPHVL